MVLPLTVKLLVQLRLLIPEHQLLLWRCLLSDYWFYLLLIKNRWVVKGSPVHLRDPLTDLQYYNFSSFREFMSTADKTSRSHTSWKSSSTTVTTHYPGLYLSKRKTAEKNNLNLVSLRWLFLRLFQAYLIDYKQCLICKRDHLRGGWSLLYILHCNISQIGCSVIALAHGTVWKSLT